MCYGTATPVAMLQFTHTVKLSISSGCKNCDEPIYMIFEVTDEDISKAIQDEHKRVFTEEQYQRWMYSDDCHPLSAQEYKDSGYDEEKAYNNAILLALERAKKVVKKLSENE